MKKIRISLLSAVMGVMCVCFFSSFTTAEVAGSWKADISAMKSLFGDEKETEKLTGDFILTFNQDNTARLEFNNCSLPYSDGGMEMTIKCSLVINGKYTVDGNHFEFVPGKDCSSKITDIQMSSKLESTLKAAGMTQGDVIDALEPEIAKQAKKTLKKEKLAGTVVSVEANKMVLNTYGKDIEFAKQ